MKRRFLFPAVLRTILAVAFLLAGGTFSHTLTETPHDHEHVHVSDASDSHAHAGNELDRHAGEHETVHCGAYLLALTSDVSLSGPDLLQVIGTVPPVPVLSRTANLDPPPPRSVLLPA